MSAILSADDLNDFISPGVACIKPVEIKNAVPRGTDNDENIEIEIGIDGTPLEVSKDEGTTKPLEQAQISLSDCLACSGCITSAEEVLVAQHSHKELLNALKKTTGDKKKFVVSLSHQSRASIAGAYGLSIEQADKFLVNLFVNKLGFTYVVGMGLGRKISLQNSSMELIKKKLNNEMNDFPILSSACPGFILYAEKTHPELITRISNIKSPQQITGLILKKISSLELQEPESNIYHLSIMPCFDKKLELARTEKDFDTDATLNEEFKDVDCVITLKELIQLLMDENFNIDELIAESNQDTTNINEIYLKYAPKNWLNAIENWMNDDGSSSGGYGLQYLLNYQSYLKAQNLIQNMSIVQITGRNSDISEFRLVNTDTNEKLASSAIVNGFRNIQNIVRKLKNPATGKKTRNLVSRRKAREAKKDTIDEGETAVEMADLSRCDYVEIMACPNGCINGGGQIASPNLNATKEWINTIEKLYYSIPISEQINYQEWLNQFYAQFGVSENRLLRTRYNKVEKLDSNVPTALAIGSKW